MGDLFLITDRRMIDREILATVKLNTEHPIFEGHFPGNPILPGVCMIQLIKELVEAQFNHPTRLEGAESIKFLQIVDPRKTCEVHVSVQVGEKNINRTKIKASIFAESVTFFKLTATLVDN